MYRAIAVTVLAAAVGLPASAQVFRCVGAGGAVSYQQQPCESGAHGGPTEIPTTFPDHVAPRAELAAQAAAADARIQKRLELESAERMARAEQASREKDMQAEREAVPAYADGWPAIFAGGPHIHHPIAKPPRLRPDLPGNGMLRPAR
ncbi:MAG TPA: DUF4124 domain-containing protein [Usitatibacter sp.]|nr:DUF4124 domain-containing protein [Usitatibacter sp.]